MISKYIKLITFYNYIIKLKPYWISHIAVAVFYIFETFAVALTMYITISELIGLKNGITPDYVLGFNTCFLLSHLIFYMLFGFFTIALFILFYILETKFKKNLIIKKGFLINNYIYHKIWLIGIYITLIISFCIFIYLITISYEGIKWLIDKWQF